MKNFFVQNKKMWIGIGCGILAVVLIVGIILMAGGNSNKDPNPTNPSTSATEPSGNVTEPTGTEPNVTEPEYTGPEDPDEPIVPDDVDPDADPTPIDPDEEPIVDPDPTPSDPTESDEPDEDRGDGPDIVPTEPDGDIIETRPPSTEYDFTGITPGNLKAEDWKSWDSEQRQAFVDTCDFDNLSLDDKYNFYLQTQFNGYDCGFEGHHCAAQEHHDQVMAEMAAGCPHCGGNDCAAFYARNMMGFTQIDFSECPQYDITKDPTEYCQTCGLPRASKAASGELCCSKSLSGTTPCSYCGAEREAGECHNCIKP